jgi:protein-L-isoaspartate(D-aspartate) O-methyltransferase
MLKRIVRVGEKDYAEEDILDCRFVPLVGRFGWEEEKAG